MGIKIKKGDTVQVMVGKDITKRGEVTEVHPPSERVIVQGVNMVKRHQSQKKGFAQSGIVEREAPLHISNVMLVDPKTDKPTRVRFERDDDGNKYRVAVKSGTRID